ncbi:hypothetical protein [Bradyrhizobium sp. Leo170]|uniref:hypothetical protein n=1 Tax=Bradyrhizobium sp. Leo170 TaxID=1571199 RepID=UPI00102EB96F|nr:hypothetical protein [Bradyrhizobium sp. Leo170]
MIGKQPMIFVDKTFLPSPAVVALLGREGPVIERTSFARRPAIADCRRRSSGSICITSMPCAAGEFLRPRVAVSVVKSRQHKPAAIAGVRHPISENQREGHHGRVMSEHVGAGRDGRPAAKRAAVAQLQAVMELSERRGLRSSRPIRSRDGRERLEVRQTLNVPEVLPKNVHYELDRLH